MVSSAWSIEPLFNPDMLSKPFWLCHSLYLCDKKCFLLIAMLSSKGLTPGFSTKPPPKCTCRFVSKGLQTFTSRCPNFMVVKSFETSSGPLVGYFPT
jgi:hypothetical protein